MNPLTETELYVETETGIETEYNFPNEIKIPVKTDIISSFQGKQFKLIATNY